MLLHPTSIGNYAFRMCNALTSVVIPPSVTSIGNNAFQQCATLTSVVIEDGVMMSIGNYAFASCPVLASVVIPPSVTSIGNNAFQFCPAITSVEIPEGVTSIGNDAFSGCSLTSVVIPASVMTINTGAFQIPGLIEVTFNGGDTTFTADLAFPNGANLRTAYMPPLGGGAGTYTRSGTVWEKVILPATYTVTFDRNNTDASGYTEANPQTMPVSAGASLGTLPLPPTRDIPQYVFNGWNTQANGSGTAFTEDTIVAESITVYAQWAVIVVPP